MRRLARSLGAAAMVLALSVPVSARTKRPVRKRSHTDWKALLTTLYDAWGTRRAENAAALYARDPDLVYFDVAPLKYEGWTAYAEGAQKLFLDKAASLSIRPNDDLKSTERGDIAWTTLTVHVTASMRDGKTLELDCRHTAIWEMRAGRWLIVHEHVSAPWTG